MQNKNNKNKLLIIVILGITGNQGGSVAKSLILENKYHIRGLTRNVNSETSKKLKEKGIEMVKCDLSNKNEVEEAFRDCDIVFAVTNFWDPNVIIKNPHEEEKQGKIIADSAKFNNVKWLLWSSLCDVELESNGKLKHVLHHTGKNKVEKYIRDLGIPSTFIYLGFYASDICRFFKIYDDGEKKIMPIPYGDNKTLIDIVDPKDTGPVVSEIIKNKDKYLNKIIPIAGDRLTFGEIAKLFEKKIGKKIEVIKVDREIISKKYPYMNNKEFIESCEWISKYGYYGSTGINCENTKKIYPNVTTFEQFLNNFDINN
jgi:uncharacterized protein YbjT (DUF2867 family)